MHIVKQHSKILRQHAEALRTIVSETIFLKSKLDNITHSLETHFLHESIEQILSNKLNLQFIHHRDLFTVVKIVSQAMTLSVDELNSSILMLEIIERLLIRQQVDFAIVPGGGSSGNDGLIGNLIITPYFAAPSPSQVPLSIYELLVVPIPFNHDTRRMQLAKMPMYVGIEPVSQQFIR